MTLIHIENVAATGQMVKVIEDFGAYAIHRVLMPGETCRLPVSRYKSVVVMETRIAAPPSGATSFLDDFETLFADGAASPRPLRNNVG